MSQGLVHCHPGCLGEKKKVQDLASREELLSHDCDRGMPKGVRVSNIHPICEERQRPENASLAYLG